MQILFDYLLRILEESGSKPIWSGGFIGLHGKEGSLNFFFSYLSFENLIHSIGDL